MSVTVKRELLVPASGEARCELRTQGYLAHDGLCRRETRGFASQCDTTDYKEYRDSMDNGRTWGAWVRERPLTKEPFGADEIDENMDYDKSLNVWNPVHRHYVSLHSQYIYVGGYAAASNRYWREGKSHTMHTFLEVREENGVSHPRQFVRYEDGAAYSRENYHETDYLTTNIARGSELIILKNGDILFDLELPIEAACRLAGIDRQKVFPSLTGNGHALALLAARGRWSAEEAQYQLSFSEPVIMDDRINTRGISEPVFAELEEGRILVIFRVSTEISAVWNCRVTPYAPSYKYYAYSDDGGKTFSPPMPWHFDTREVIYSSATFCRLLRSSRNGRLYWFGNITDPLKSQGNYPRYPLQMVEVDEEWGAAKKDTLVVIDTRQEGETEQVQLSNFCLLEDRETGSFELYLSKLGQFPGRPVWDCETWKYTISL